jgi:hypothetical protein
MLVHVAMQGSDIEAMALQRAIEDADVLLAVAEDDGVLDVDLPLRLLSASACRQDRQGPS